MNSNDLNYFFKSSQAVSKTFQNTGIYRPRNYNLTSKETNHWPQTVSKRIFSIKFKIGHRLKQYIEFVLFKWSTSTCNTIFNVRIGFKRVCLWNHQLKWGNMWCDGHITAYFCLCQLLKTMPCVMICMWNNIHSIHSFILKSNLDVKSVAHTFVLF